MEPKLILPNEICCVKSSLTYHLIANSEHSYEINMTSMQEHSIRIVWKPQVTFLAMRAFWRAQGAVRRMCQDSFHLLNPAARVSVAGF